MSPTLAEEDHLTRYLSLALIAIVGAAAVYAEFAAPIEGIVQYSRISTAALGAIMFLGLVAPTGLFASLALNSARLAARPPWNEWVVTLLSLPLAGLVSVMITPAAAVIWAVGPIGGLIACLAVAAMAGSFWIALRPAVPNWVKLVLNVATFAALGCVLLLSSLGWLALPFGIVCLPFAAFFSVSSVVVTMAWWLLFGASRGDPVASNRALLQSVWLFGLVALMADAALQAVLASRTTTVTRQMHLKPGGSGAGCARVLLLDERCTALTREVCSDELSRYLGSMGNAMVPVTYSITDDFGKVWSYRIRSIGPVRVDIRSNESVKKLDDVRCMFLP